MNTANEVEELLDNLAHTDEEDFKASKRYHVSTHFYGKSFDTIDEARGHIEKAHKRNPYDMSVYLIAEIIEASRSKPQGEVDIQIIDLKTYFNSKQIEKQDAI